MLILRRIVALYDRFLDLCGIAPGYIAGLIALGIVADIFGRNVGLGGIGWMLETVEYLIYALTFIGTGYVLRQGRHVRVELLADMLAPKPRRALEILAATLALAISLVLLAFATRATLSAHAQQSMVYKSFAILEWVPLSLLIPTTLMLSLECLRHLIRLVQRGGAARARAGHEGL